MVISVVIPAHNEESELPWCLAAIKAASQRCFRPIEIIVVDNASTDSTAKVAELNGAVVVTELCKGTGFARQAGLEASSGEIICFIDADTRMPSYWFRRLISHFDKGVVAVSGPSFFYDLPRLRRVLPFIFDLVSYMIHRLYGVLLNGGNCAVLRHALEQAGELDTSIEFYGDDTDLARRVSHYGKIRWEWDMAMPSSSRRIRGMGTISAGLLYALNYLSVVFLNRPATTTHKDYR